MSAAQLVFVAQAAQKLVVILQEVIAYAEQSVLVVHAKASQIFGDEVLQIGVTVAQLVPVVQASHFFVVILQEGTVSPVQSALVAQARQTLLVVPWH